MIKKTYCKKTVNSVYDVEKKQYKVTLTYTSNKSKDSNQNKTNGGNTHEEEN